MKNSTTVSFQLEPITEQLSILIGVNCKISQRKACEFICFLIANGSGQFATVEQIHKLPAWNRASAASVGKQVARLVKDMQKDGFDIFECPQKTKKWQLNNAAARAVNSQLLKNVENFISGLSWSSWKRFDGIAATDIATWATDNIRAMLDLAQGRVDEGYKSLRSSLDKPAHSDLFAIILVLLSCDIGLDCHRLRKSAGNGQGRQRY